jgi:DMSO/TMAO reductase YedYZ molybdopterin-dependent catalytic subunit
MGFFDRQRSQLQQAGIDPSRLPPGQYTTDRFPVLHVGHVPEYRTLDDWTLTIDGLVAAPVTITWQQLQALDHVSVITDIHCVTKWSKFDTAWSGVPFETLLELAGGPTLDAKHVLLHADNGYTTNIPLVDCLSPNTAMVADSYDSQPLEPAHGYPARFLLPHLYLWKSAKWIRRIELMSTQQLGFWERNGYHAYGDPFREQRFS